MYKTMQPIIWPNNNNSMGIKHILIHIKVFRAGLIHHNKNIQRQTTHNKMEVNKCENNKLRKCKQIMQTKEIETTIMTTYLNQIM